MAEETTAGDSTGAVHIVCDWKDADPFPHFIEAETPDGKSVVLPWFDRAFDDRGEVA